MDKAAAEQQFSEYWEWSRFYHDAEIKVNGGSIFIAALGSLAKDFSGTSTFTIPVCGRNLSVIGLIIVVASVAALLSTLGYWRYYELCDIYAKEFRKQYIDRDEIELIRSKVQTKLLAEYPIIHRFVNIHHLIWIVVQLSIIVLGIFIALQS